MSVNGCLIVFLFYVKSVQTARKVGKSIEANFPAVRRQALFDLIIIIDRASRILVEYFPDASQLEKYAF